jgi:ArsR family transcriptional regulator, arsenate/arsenite/antimonite-responsive transcriptional repressor
MSLANDASGMDDSMSLESISLEATAGFAAVADGTRLRILQVLASGGRCVCDLRAEVPVPANLLSYHLRVLRDAGLVNARRRGRWIDYEIDEQALERLRAELPRSEQSAAVSS